MIAQSTPPIPPIPLQDRAHLRQGMTFRFIPLNDWLRLAGWILEIGVLLFSVGSEGSEVVAQGLGYL